MHSTTNTWQGANIWSAGAVPNHPQSSACHQHVYGFQSSPNSIGCIGVYGCLRVYGIQWIPPLHWITWYKTIQSHIPTLLCFVVPKNHQKSHSSQRVLPHFQLPALVCKVCEIPNAAGSSRLPSDLGFRTIERRENITKMWKQSHDLSNLMMVLIGPYMKRGGTWIWFHLSNFMMVYDIFLENKVYLSVFVFNYGSWEDGRFFPRLIRWIWAMIPWPISTGFWSTTNEEVQAKVEQRRKKWWHPPLVVRVVRVV